MRQPSRGGKSLRVFALLTFLVAACSLFGQVTRNGVPPINREDSGFVLGVEESDATMINYDVTGAPTVNPFVRGGDTFSTVRVRGREQVEVGESTSAGFTTGFDLRPLFGLNDTLGNLHQPPPTKSFVRAGPFYLQFYDITAGLLVSDNVNFVPHDAEWGAIAELRLRLTAILQIAPTWRLAVSGSIIYLPFKNEFGVEGFGLGDALGFIAKETLSPITRMQLAYNSRWDDWRVQLVDDFTLRYITVGGGYNGVVDADIQPEGIHAEDRAGRYVFGNGTTIPDRGLERRQNDFLDVNTFLQLENRIVGSAERVLPTETRATVGAAHTDFWYQGNWDTGGNSGTNGLGFSTTSEDRIFAALRNERESMRFKPYVFYDAYRYNYNPDWTHQAGAGFSGPITENMLIRVEGGYAWGAALLNSTWFYRAVLVHTLGPFTRQYLEYSRDVTEPVSEIRDSYIYGINQVLGPGLVGRLFMERSVFQPNQSGVYGSVEDGAGMRVTWVPAPRHTYIIGANYAESRFANISRDRETRWEARAQVQYRLRPDLELSFIYRYLNIDTKQSFTEFDTAENLWTLSATKLF